MSAETFVVEKKVINVKLPDGTSVKVCRPSMKQLHSVQKKLAEVKPEEATKVLEEYFVSLGLSQEVLDEHFDASHFMDLFTMLSGVKKNLTSMTQE